MQGARQNDPRPSACRLRRQRVFALRLAVSNGARHAGAVDLRLFFRWIKHHLRLRGFFSTDPSGVPVQIWTALCTYLLVSLAKCENALPDSPALRCIAAKPENPRHPGALQRPHLLQDQHLALQARLAAVEDDRL